MAVLSDKGACNIYDDVIRCEVPTPNLNSANKIFYAQFGAKSPNLKTVNISGYTVRKPLETIVIGIKMQYCTPLRFQH